MKWRTRGTRVAARPGGAKASDAHPAPDAPGQTNAAAQRRPNARQRRPFRNESDDVRAGHGASFAGAAVPDGLIRRGMDVGETC